MQRPPKFHVEHHVTDSIDSPQPPVGGCELCGDFPAVLRARCHPSAPLRAVATSFTSVELRCYLPSCDRLVATLVVQGLSA